MIWNKLKLETLTPEQKDLLGVKLSAFPPIYCRPFRQKNQNDWDQLSMEHIPSATLIGLASYALVAA